MLAELDQLESEALAALSSATDESTLETWRITYLGSKGRLKGMMPLLKDVDKAER